MHFVKSLKNVLVSESSSLREALTAMNRNGLQILLIVDKDNRLVGLVTDGDIRRYILTDQSTDVAISNIANRNFISIRDKDRGKIADLFNNSGFKHIPVVDDSGCVVSLVIESGTNLLLEEGKEVPVVVMAGGKGTRLSPLTRIIPKPLVPVGDKTMIEKIMDSLAGHGFKDFRVVVNYKMELIKSYLGDLDLPYKLTFYEENEFLGTSGGLHLLKKHIDGPFLLTNCDVIANLDYKAFLEWHLDHRAQLTILGVRKRTEIPYGVVTVDDNSYVTSLEEKPAYNHVIMSGIYILNSSVLDLLIDGKYLNMDQLISLLLSSGEKVTCYPIEDDWFDMGQLDEYRNFLQHLGVTGA